MVKVAENLERIIQTQFSQFHSETSSMPGKEDEKYLFADIFDNDLFDNDLFEKAREDAENEVEPDEIDFSRFDRIPISTFWNSQRSRSKVAKKKEILKAIRRTTNVKALDSTLLETMPRSRKKGFVFLSPELKPIDSKPIANEAPSKSLEYLQSDFYETSIPPFLL
jgi:hypothetical protein